MINDNIPNDLIYVQDRQDGRRSGGLVYFLNNNIPCTQLTDLGIHEHEAMWLLYPVRECHNAQLTIL